MYAEKLKDRFSDTLSQIRANRFTEVCKFIIVEESGGAGTDKDLSKLKISVSG